MDRNSSIRIQITAAAVGLFLVGCDAPSSEVAATGDRGGEVATIQQAFRTGTVLGTIGIDATTGALATIQSASAGSRLGGWLLSLDDVVQSPGMVGDFDGDGFDDFVIRSGWGIGVIGNTSSDVLTSKALTQFGTNIGLNWILSATDRVVAVGKFGSTSNPAEMVLRGASGFAFVKINAGNLQAVTVVNDGSVLWDSSNQVGWLVGAADRVLRVGRFGGGADALAVSSGWGWSIWVPGFSSAAPTILHIAPNGEMFGSWQLDTNDPRFRVVAALDMDGASDGKEELVALSRFGFTVLHRNSAGAWGAAAMDARFYLKDGKPVAGHTTRPTLDWLVSGANLNGNSRRDLLFQSYTGLRIFEKNSGAWSLDQPVSHDYDVSITGGWGSMTGDQLLSSLVGNFDGTGNNDFVITSRTRTGILTINGGDVKSLAMADNSALPYDEPERLIAAGKFDHSGRARILYKNVRPPVTPPSPAVLTYHNDNARTGLNASEAGLAPSTVSANGMKAAYTNLFASNPPGAEDEIVSAQVLYAPNMTIRGTTRYPFFVFTTQNELFSWDLGAPGIDSGQFNYAYFFPDFEDAANGTQNRPKPLGIWGTPVIDYNGKTIYFVMRTGSTTGPFNGGMDPNFQTTFYLVAWDIEREGWKGWKKIEGSYPQSSGEPLMFLPENHSQRAALLLSQGSVYIAFGAQWQEEQHAYHGWLFRYDAETFDQLGVFCTSPNQYAKDANGNYTGVAYPGKGAGIWMAGGGPAADSLGQVYLETGNGPSDASTGTYGDYFLKLSPRGYTLQLHRSAPGDNTAQDLFNRDWDLGGGGPVVLESSSRIVGGGKEGKYYVFDMNTFAKQQEFQGYNNLWFPNWPNQAPDGFFWWGSPHLHGQPVAFNGKFYHQAEMDYLRGFAFNGTFSSTGALVTNDRRVAPLSPAYMRTQLSASSNGTSSGVIWSTIQAIDDNARRNNPRIGCSGNAPTVNRISAHDATNLNCLWSDNLDADINGNLGAIPKQSPPTVVGSRVIMAIPRRGPGVVRAVRVYMPGASGEGRDCPTDIPAIPSPPCN